MKRALQILAIAFGSIAALAAAEEICKSAQLKNSSPTLSDIYAMAQAHAKAWKADAIPARIGNTSLGPLQPDGGSTAWNLMFFSESANANVSISTFRGTYRCWAQPGPAGGFRI